MNGAGALGCCLHGERFFDCALERQPFSFCEKDTLDIFTLEAAHKTITQCLVKEGFEITRLGQVPQFSDKFSNGLTVSL